MKRKIVLIITGLVLFFGILTINFVNSEGNFSYCELDSDCHIVLADCHICPPCTDTSILDTNVISVNSTFQCNSSSEEEVICAPCIGTIDYNSNENAVCINNKCEKISNEGLFISYFGVQYSPGIEVAFEDSNLVPVIVELRDNSGIEVTGTKEERRILLNQKNEWFSEIIDEVLSNLTYNHNENLAKGSTGFSGEISKEIFEILSKDERIQAIYMDVEVHAVLDDLNKSDNLTVDELEDGFGFKKELSFYWLWVFISIVLLVIIGIILIIKKRKMKGGVNYEKK